MNTNGSSRSGRAHSFAEPSHSTWPRWTHGTSPRSMRSRTDHHARIGLGRAGFASAGLWASSSPVARSSTQAQSWLVTSTAKKILDAAMGLPQAERRLLAEALLESTAEESAHEIDPAWRDEVLRRIEQVRRGEVKPEPLSEVRRQIREALAR